MNIRIPYNKKIILGFAIICFNPLSLMAQDGLSNQAPQSLYSQDHTTLLSEKDYSRNEKIKLKKAERLSLPDTSRSPKSLFQVYEDIKADRYKGASRMGPQDGGGGKIILAPADDQISTILQDLYEAPSFGFQIFTGMGLTFTEKIEFIFKRLDRLDPERSKLYREWAAELLDPEGTDFRSNVILPITEDSGVAPIPVGSFLVQIAVQRSEKMAKLLNVKRYVIDQDLFYQLDPISQVGLVLHEVIYRELRAKASETSSERVRYLVGLLMSHSADIMNPRDFGQLMKLME